MLDLIRKLEGKSDRERFAILLEEVRARNWQYLLQEYQHRKQYGCNLIIDLIAGRPTTILLVAHYDSFIGSPAANDDASALAVLIDAGERIADLNPAKNIRMIFFDDEEPTVHWFRPLGSTKYVQEFGIESLHAVIDLEMCGLGDAVGIWPVKDMEDRPMVLQISEMLSRMKVPYDYGYQVPGFYADYEPFRKAGFLDAYCLTVFDWAERDLVRAFSESSHAELVARYVRWKTLKQPVVPRLFQHYHTSADRSEFISEEALSMMSDVVVELVKELGINHEGHE
ncbi:M28 family peptidase [bacterium]|nr:M28 family peptidase [bacterium]